MIPCTFLLLKEYECICNKVFDLLFQSNAVWYFYKNKIQLKFPFFSQKPKKLYLLVVEEIPEQGRKHGIVEIGMSIPVVDWWRNCQKLLVQSDFLGPKQKMSGGKCKDGAITIIYQRMNHICVTKYLVNFSAFLEVTNKSN